MDSSQTSHLSTQEAAAMWQDVDRRHVGRANCGLGGLAKSLEQTRPQPVAVGGSFPVTVSDLSDTGARLNTPHQLGVGDLIEITVESPAGNDTLRRSAKIVWAGQVHEFQWCAGIEFIDG